MRKYYYDESIKVEWNIAKYSCMEWKIEKHFSTKGKILACNENGMVENSQNGLRKNRLPQQHALPITVLRLNACD